MSRYTQEPQYDHGTPEANGVLLVNLGTPDAPTAKAVRRYLGEFLWDPRVVELPRPLWWLILHGVILRVRPKRSAKAYQEVWTDEGAPLLVHSRRLAEALETELNRRFPTGLHVALGMRYGQPSVASALEQLRAANVRRLLVLPLYPQYSATTTAATFDAVADVLRTWRWLPELRLVARYHDFDPYLKAVEDSIRRAWQERSSPEKLLFSFHGLPKRNLLAGDPYHCQCHKTARQVAERLGLPDDAWAVSFQSRFGKAEWLKPYTYELLGGWAREGVKRVDVVCPGFAADCLETLEEIAIENGEEFLAAGGESFNYIPALNDSPSHVRCLADLVAYHTQGWHTGQAAGATEPTDEARRRALAMGATR